MARRLGLQIAGCRNRGWVRLCTMSQPHDCKLKLFTGNDLDSAIFTVHLTAVCDDTKPYVLTAMSKEFVHYTMNGLVTRLEPNTPA